MQRSSHGTYHDPLDLVWLACAERIGMRVERSHDVYAAWDGKGTLHVTHVEHFDPDDSLAQLVLHEICHALVEGPGAWRKVDWGLDPDGERGAVREHACHRLQAALLDLYGLRELLSVTTDWRPYWDALPADPLADDGDPAVPLARDGWREAMRGPWSEPLRDALRATAALADAVRPFAPAHSLWSRTRPRTPVGLACGAEGTTCGGCAWRDGNGRCVALAEPGEDGPPVKAAWPGCLRHEPRFDEGACRACGACCREGFGAVGLDADDEVVRARPDWVVHAADGLYLPRPDGRCTALCHDGVWTCTVYAIRPRACREFEPGGEHCLAARRRTGLSRT